MPDGTVGAGIAFYFLSLFPEVCLNAELDL
jgi:hypothetical protein